MRAPPIFLALLLSAASSGAVALPDPPAVQVTAPARSVSTAQFAVSVAPATATVVAGGSVVLMVGTTAVAGQPEQVALAAGGLPPSVLAVFAPAVVASGGSAKLTLTAQPNLVAGVVYLLVAGSAPSGVYSTSALLTTLSAPITTISSPVVNAIVSGLVPVVVTTTVSPGTALASVQLLVDGQAAAASASSSPVVISWESGTVKNGEHLLSIQATDLAGGSSNSSKTVAVDVENTGSGCASSNKGKEGKGSGAFEALGFLGLFALTRKRSGSVR